MRDPGRPQPDGHSRHGFWARGERTKRTVLRALRGLFGVLVLPEDPKIARSSVTFDGRKTH